MLGGSSAINAEAFIAPARCDLDEWARRVGDQEWDFDHMLPYYRKFHTLDVPKDQEVRDHLGIDWVNNKISGVDGPVQASFQGVVQDPLSKAWVDTFESLNGGFMKDPFSGEALGGYSSPITVDSKTKTRSYAANAYLPLANDRNNLHVVTGAHVNKILFSSPTEPLTATGILATLQSSEDSVALAARKEVILAAGAFQSPKILELSGIGNPAILKQHKIDVRVSNPAVGENLQDHLMTGVSYEVKDGIFTGDALMRQEPESLQGAMQLYTTAKAGPLCAGGIGSYAFMPLWDVLADEDEQDRRDFIASIQFNFKDAPDTPEIIHQHFVNMIYDKPSLAAGSFFMFPAQVNLHADPMAKDFLQELLPGAYLSLGCALLHPRSRGSAHIASADVAQPPIIDPQYLSDELDLEVLARFVLYLEKLAATEPLKSQLKENGRRNHRSAHFSGQGRLDAAKAYVKASVISNNHPVGTCAMGPKERDGVVDKRLIVHGTTNLRVIDASIMPTIPGGNCQSSVYAVAEKAADLIKGAV